MSSVSNDNKQKTLLHPIFDFKITADIMQPSRCPFGMRAFFSRALRFFLPQERKASE